VWLSGIKREVDRVDKVDKVDKGAGDELSKK
jgi:hypothetical protein